MAPADYRKAERDAAVPPPRVAWAQTVVQSPSSACLIKGNHSRRGEWIYHLPGMPYYDQTRAEQMLCTEAEASGRLSPVTRAVTMLSDWELWACARHYVDKHGEDAAVLAAMRADELLATSYFRGARNYKAIIRRINELLAAPVGPLN